MLPALGKVEMTYENKITFTVSGICALILLMFNKRKRDWKINELAEAVGLRAEDCLAIVFLI